MTLNVLMTIGHRAHTDRVGLRWIVVGLVPGSLVALLASIRWRVSVFPETQ